MPRPEVTLEPITAANWSACVRLKVSPDQESLIASNAISLAQAAYQTYCTPLAVYSETAAGHTMVGFVMYAHPPSENEYWIYRIMVGADFQRHGYGRSAVLALLKLMAKLSNCTRVLISYFPTNTVARDLYLGLGFQETGEIDPDGEAVACFDFRETPLPVH